MAQPFDITLKHLLESHPADCLQLVGLPTTAPVDVIDADLATVSAEADKVIRVKDRKPWLMHFEMQASYDAELPRRMLRYNVLLNYRHGLPVRSVVVLLRPQADGPEMTGVVRQTLAGEQYLEFHYRILRIWQKPVEEILTGGVGTLPLAPLARVKRPELPAVVRRMRDRVTAELPPAEQAVVWTETLVLMGLRYEAGFATELLKGARTMKESVTYQAIVREGEAKGAVEEAQRLLLRQGAKKLGDPNKGARAVVEQILDLNRLEALFDRVDQVNSWQELLAEPQPRRRTGKRRA
ncbi:MAG: Rpn family recombination-promoting nuclease/putative transposase [Gemmataceae bacterium]